MDKRLVVLEVLVKFNCSILLASGRDDTSWWEYVAEKIPYIMAKEQKKKERKETAQGSTVPFASTPHRTPIRLYVLIVRRLLIQLWWEPNL